MHFTPSHRSFAPALGRALAAWISALLLATSSPALFAAAPPGARTGTGKIGVTTQPAGATIFVDGHPSGKTPGEVDGLGPGRYFVRVELPGYRPAELVVELSSGQNYRTSPIELVSVNAPRPVETAPPPPAPSPVPRRTEATPPSPPARRAETMPAPATPQPSTPPPVPAPIPPPTASVTPIPAFMRTTPAPVAAAAPAPPPAPAGDADETIQQLVTTHLKTIADGDIAGYLKMCAPKVDYYDEGTQSHDGIRKIRQKQKDRWPVYEIANVHALSVRGGSQADVRRASVSYDWSVSNPSSGKKASGTANDVIEFKQVGGQWLIVKTRQNVDRNKSRNQ